MSKILVISESNVEKNPYGVLCLKDQGHKIYSVSDAKNPFHIKIRDVIEHRSGIKVDKAIRSFIHALRSDFILCFLEEYARFPLKMRRLGAPGFKNKNIVMISCWLAEELKNASPEEKQKLYERYKDVDVNFVFSANQTDILTSCGFDASTIVPIKFGTIPGRFEFVPQEERQTAISAVGFDRGRDYPTLFKAMQEVDAELELCCHQEDFQGMEVPENVHFRGVIPGDEYEALVSDSQIVAIPTYQLAYPTGQSVALEAGSTGAALILTDSEPMKEYFTSEEVYFVDEGDVQGWQEALQTLLVSPELRKKLGENVAKKCERYTVATLWHSVVQALHERGIINETH